ncbi:MULTISPECIES: HAMP domain-containing sensor histidine kinase [Aneurinibacillus]|uniref:Sensor histidine kinase n=1 Tax=Aneurinibacillus danicus TaxID=267746 RepID=A0A511V7J7_9BACL|nr:MULTISPECIES: sensor histidine kinase [Aneurinibacillus]GEN34936.1 sensor histidine kinase LiaS [Aneurinibacillus danicus]
MSERRLTNIQWQFMRQSLWGSVGAVTAGSVIFCFIWYEMTSVPTLKQWVLDKLGWNFPMFPGILFAFVMLLFLCLVAALVGTSAGYIYGNLMKKRVEILLQSAMLIERGNLSTRVPYLGEDEVGLLGERLNEMTIRFQQQVLSLQRLSAHNAELTEQVKQSAVNEERQRLARELHDAVSQQLFAISMTMAAVRRTLSQNPEKASRQVELVEEMAAAAQSEMRALLLHLRPTQLEGKSLREGIEGLLIELQTKHSLELSWQIDDIPSLSKGMEDHLFRILQEALSNALRHARATKLEVKLVKMQNQMRLRITDDGIGFAEGEEKKSSSYGMKLMEERVAEIGGVLVVSSAPGHGTMIEVTVPFVG